MERCFTPFGVGSSSFRAPVHWYRRAFSAPAGIRPAQHRPAGAILPGGRIILPEGEQFITGSGPFGLAVSPEGKSVVTANGGPGRNSLTILEHDKNRHWDVRHLLARTKGDADDGEDADWRSVFMGIAFVNEHSAWVSEGNSGKIALFDWNSSAQRAAARHRPESEGLRRQLHRAIWRWTPNAACSTSWIRPTSGWP